MRTVTFANVLNGICDQLGWDPDLLDADEFNRIKRAVSASLDEIQKATWWSDLVQTERIQYEDTWSASASYTVGEFVYYPPADAYFQCAQDNSGQAPQASGDSNLAHWIPAELSLAAEAYDADATYAVGDLVLATDGQYYTCIRSAFGYEPESSPDYWSVVAAWVPTLSLERADKAAIGNVEGLYEEDPRVWRFPDRISFTRCIGGIIPLQCVITPRPWVRYLPIPHAFDGATWSASATYTAVGDAERSVT